ncbi:hypothetical protein [Achromobacter sp. AONIH1]|nr:hypothetical protein [Achromobacter sp. AONIH1]
MSKPLMSLLVGFSSPMHGEGNGPAVPRPDVASAGGAPGRAAQA